MKSFYHTFFQTLLFFCIINIAHAEEWKLLFGLKGFWKFEIGDDMNRKEQKFDDSKWETITAPSPWEDQGFPGYDGYAWYRKHFHSSESWKRKYLTLQLGNIDDVDEVYLNGHLIGTTGIFPPFYQSAYNMNRVYQFSAELLNPSGDNVIAVRVYDQELGGGIIRGELGIFEDIQALQVDIPIISGWKFQTGDKLDWRNPEYEDSSWKSIIVPSFWENAGYKDYDGFGWYRVKFRLPYNLSGKQLILLLGKIDDFDETYLNGVNIGHTGTMEEREYTIPGSNAYQQLRAYTIPSSILHREQDNTIAVRVYDGFKEGGIYNGPIGIITREKYLQWQNHQKRSENFFDWLFK